ncbi:MAG: hypothetical protein K9L68_01195 [Spirochaetales bacterium]|nr:hypothetical protein [Spirochaetales bacterium]MCF7937192.1 hypothetical protein [Spirochaetales bacterium]
MRKDFRKRLTGPAFLLLFFTAVLFPLQAAEAGESLQNEGSDQVVEKEVLDPITAIVNGRAYSLRITASILQKDSEVSWNAEKLDVTLSGKPVNIKLLGTNVKIIAEFTPYNQDENSVLLIAQGQVWVGSSPGEEVKYISTIKSIPVDLGERIYFFPLGRHAKGKSGSSVIQLEVQVLPYEAEGDEVENTSESSKKN